RRAADGAMVLILHEQESTGLMSLAGTLRAASEQGLEEIIVIVGPEGGISPRSSRDCANSGPARSCSVRKCCAPRPPARPRSPCSARCWAAGAEPEPVPVEPRRSRREPTVGAGDQ